MNNLTIPQVVKPLLLAIIGFFVGLTAPIVVLIALPFIKWDDTHWGRYGRLPRWASWYDTPDNPLPGDMTESGVNRVFIWCGKWVCSYYWLVIRNRAHGFDFQFAQPIPAPWPPEPGFYNLLGTGIWWVRKPIFGGRLQLKMGYRSYHVDNQWWGVPCLTVTVP